jgi:hypothetical protein
MVLDGSVTLPYGGTAGDRLFVANGVAYVGAADSSGNGGYLTVDVSNPVSPTLIEGPDARNIAGTAIALNGSGLGVSVQQLQIFLQGLKNVVDVVNTSSPNNTGQFVTRYTLPSQPYDVAIGDGIAFVADGTSGLQVVNYRSFDTQGLVRDTAPPKLVTGNISEIAVRAQTFRSFTFYFSKPLDPTTVTSSSFELIGPGGTAITSQSIELRNNNKEVEVTYPTLAVGSYQYVINAPQITDAAGNVMGAASLTTDFTVQPFSITWNNPSGGDWNTASNWSTGNVPGALDVVGVSLSPGATIAFAGGSDTISNLFMNDGRSPSAAAASRSQRAVTSAERCRSAAARFQ